MVAYVVVPLSGSGSRPPRRLCSTRAGGRPNLLLAQFKNGLSHICSAHFSDNREFYWKHCYGFGRSLMLQKATTRDQYGPGARAASRGVAADIVAPGCGSAHAPAPQSRFLLLRIFVDGFPSRHYRNSGCRRILTPVAVICGSGVLGLCCNYSAFHQIGTYF